MGKKVASLSLFLLASLWQATDGLGERLKFTTTVRTHPILVMPVLAAEEQGYWKQQGLEVQWVPVEGDRAAMQAISAASLDAGLGGTSGNILATARGVPTIIVADMQVKDYGFRIWLRGDSPAREPKDLKGYKIGVNLFGGLAHNYGVMAIKALGLEKEVKFLSLGGVPQTIAGLRAGAIDGVVLTIFAMANLKRRGQTKEIVSMVDFIPQKWSEIIIFAHSRVVRESPAAVKKAVAAVLQSTRFILTNRPWAVEKLKTFFKFEGEWDWIYDRINYGPDGKIDREAIENVRNFLTEYGILPKDKPVPLEKLYTLEFTG